MKSQEGSKKYILVLWSIAVAIGTNSSPFTISIAISFAAGTMLAESMIPEAHQEGGSSRIGIATMVGFAIAFSLED